MPRKIMVQLNDGSRPVLSETLAESEAQLQKILQDHPELLPIDEFGMTGPLMVVGRETVLASGAVDLVGMARTGEIVVIEFKTGPQNPDFRHTLAQLLDFGSDLWRMSYEEFESTVAIRYFSSFTCTAPQTKGKTSLEAAMHATWPDLSDEDTTQFRQCVSRELSNGSFHYVAVAQRFTPAMVTTIEYLNALTSTARFYAVELVRFSASGISAFESRTVIKPSTRLVGGKSSTPIDEVRFLESVSDQAYREALGQFLELCRGLKLRADWGTVGVSLRLSTPDRAEPLTIGWLFPPGASGWSGLTDLTLGYDQASAQYTPSVAPALSEYLQKVAGLPGVVHVKAKGLRAYHLTPGALMAARHLVPEIIARIVEQVGTPS